MPEHDLALLTAAARAAALSVLFYVDDLEYLRRGDASAGPAPRSARSSR